MSSGLMEQAFVFLGAGVITVPIAKRLGLGSVLGYLIAGAIIGPYALGIVGSHINNVMHFAEFGVVMMLFLVGLELQPSILWKLRLPIVGLGGAQVVLSTLVITGVALLLGIHWQMALVVGMILALSSTAIVLQLLNENGLMNTHLGQSSFAVLLFQDIAVIPMLALMPLLAVSGGSNVNVSQVSELSGWQHALQLIAVIGGIILAGKFLLRPLFRFIAETKMREIFTATALFLVIGIALLMESIGVSAALGTFLAGVVLAESEYRHELEAEIAPFKGLLLGLFFISVGASINFSILLADPGLIGSLVLGLILCKMLVLFILGKFFNIQRVNRWYFAFALSQAGEFCFVLFSFAGQHHILTAEIIDPLVVVVALSMAVTPILMILNDKVIEPLFSGVEQAPAQADEIDDGVTPVILAGMGRFGQIVARLLTMKGYQVTVLEHDATQVELVRKYGTKVFYGDASRVDLLHAAGAETAKLLIVAVDEHEKTLEIVAHARKHYPHLKILVRAIGRLEVHELQESGADTIVRETFHSALNLGEQALTALGVSVDEAQRSAAIFKHHDEKNILAMASLHGDEKGYRSQSQENYKALAEVLQADSADANELKDACEKCD